VLGDRLDRVLRDAPDFPVVGDADQEQAAVGVGQRGDAPGDRVGHVGRVFDRGCFRPDLVHQSSDTLDRDVRIGTRLARPHPH
jgi:hypothetical protein